MDKAQKAENLFIEGFNCSQSVLSSFCEILGLETEQALKIAHPFGGGMSRMGKTCGAVTGAMMVIGLKLGRIEPEKGAIKDKAYIKVEEFMNRFTSIHGSLACRELIGYDIRSSNGLNTAKEKKIFETICPQLIKSSVEILEEIV